MNITEKYFGGAGIKRMIARYFSYLSLTKRPRKNAPDSEWFYYFVKHYIGESFFVLVNKYHAFITYLTRYYPFSLLYKDRLFHAANKPGSDFMRTLEDTAWSKDFLIRVISGQELGETAEFIGKFEGKIHDREKVLGELEKVFQSKYGSIYVRDINPDFRVLVPTTLVYN